MDADLPPGPSSAYEPLLFVIGPTASGKSAKAVALAKELNGEVISVDSRQVYRTLDIGTEKISVNEMDGIPHHLIDVREPEEVYTAGDFVSEANRLITDIISRGKRPILAGGTHFYFDALIYGLPVGTSGDAHLRTQLETLPSEELFSRIEQKDPRRAERIDRHNRRRLVRAVEILETEESVPLRDTVVLPYAYEWVVVDQEREVLRERLTARLTSALSRGLIEEVERVRAQVGDARLSELGLEYRIIGEFLRGELPEAELLPKLNAKLWQYAKRQKAWIRKLTAEAASR